MPTKYKRKVAAMRGNWTEEALKAAINAVKNDGVSVRAASISYKIPRKTLERRCKKNDYKKGPMGPSSCFGNENEKKLAAHIRSMQAKGFPLTMDDARKIAYELAEQLKLKHRFNQSIKKAGYDWLHMFLGRNPDIVLRKSEGVSLARTNAMNRSEVNDYFQLLEGVLMKDGEMIAPNCVFNMDETGLQLNNRPGHVLAQRGSKAISTITSTEKGETITVIACCNAEGTFLPPACIMKGKNKKAEFEDGMPPGSKLFMSVKSAYITSTIFLEWLKTHFVPRKPAGKVVLLLDGHSTHCNSVEMLEYANENDIVLISMPSHTSHYLQPLDRSVFKSLKNYFYEQCRLWLKQNPSRRISRLSFGALLCKAWGKAAAAENAISGFRATGVYPFNPDAIPDYAFSQESVKFLSETSIERARATSLPPVTRATPSPPLALATPSPPLAAAEDKSTPNCSFSQSRLLNFSPELVPKKPKPSLKIATLSDISDKMPGIPNVLPSQNADNKVQDLTPSRILQEISPIPQKLLEVRKRAKQVGILLTSEEHMEARKNAEDAKKKRAKKGRH